MKTRLKRKKPNIIGKKFFDNNIYGLGYFTVLKAWSCKEYCQSSFSPDGGHWIYRNIILIKTDSGIKYKIPYCPYLKIIEVDTGILWDKYYNYKPW